MFDRVLNTLLATIPALFLKVSKTEVKEITQVVVQSEINIDNQFIDNWKYFQIILVSRIMKLSPLQMNCQRKEHYLTLSFTYLINLAVT